jgi:hypothetical protein
MKKEEFAFIGCRLFALFWLVRAIYSISSLMVSWAAWKENISDSPRQLEGMFYYSLVPFVLYLTVAIFFWFAANHIVKRIIPADISSQDASGITVYQTQSVIFSGVAILILFSSLPEISGVLYKCHLAKQFDSYSNLSFNDKAQFLELAIRLALGIGLLFGARGLSGLLIKVRELGVK